MRFLNNKISLFLFLLINIVCVTYGSLQDCIDELLVEFKNRDPMDDFLIAYLNIKFINIGFSKQTRDNEELYCGNNDLTFAARGYYLELYYTLQDMDLPLLLSPYDYCRTEHRNDESDCLRDIDAIGCGVNYEGVKCLKHLYLYWKQTVDPNTTPGTEYLSDKILLKAIIRGSDKFRNLSGSDLIEALYRRPKTINRLSDENLLNDSGYVPPEIPESFDIAESLSSQPSTLNRTSKYEAVDFIKYHEFLSYTRHQYNYSREIGSIGGARTYNFDDYLNYTAQLGHSENGFSTLSDYQDFLNYTKYRLHYPFENSSSANEAAAFRDYTTYTDFMQYLQSEDPEYEEFVRNEGRRRMEFERKRQIKENETIRENHLRDARYDKYGIADASYMDICKEYIRRQNTTRSFDYYYTMYIYDTLKDSSCNRVFKNCTDYCVKYVSDQQ